MLQQRSSARKLKYKELLKSCLLS